MRFIESFKEFFLVPLDEMDKVLEEQKKEEDQHYFTTDLSQIKQIDPFNPFDNPTENHKYNESYADIVPQINVEGCHIPNIPSDAEKRRIKHFYNTAGWGMIIHFALSFVLANVFQLLTIFFIMIKNDIKFSEFTGNIVDNVFYYMDKSTIYPAINTLVFLICNISVFFFGMKFLKIKPNSLFKTTDLTIKKIISYIFIGFFIQYIAGLIISLISTAINDADIMGNSQSLNTFYSPKYAIISILYSCIVAPVTEELLYRGFILKGFSKVSQHFGIMMSALFFGLIHGNVAQFTLALIIGIFMAYIDIKHNSVLPSIIVHMAVNTMATISSITENYFNESPVIAKIIFIIVALCSAIGLFILIKFLPNNIFPKSDIRQQFREKNVAFTSVGVVLALIIYTTSIICNTFIN